MEPSPARNPRVAIPQLSQNRRRPHQPTGKSTAARGRITKACFNCRRRKTKCSGEIPCRSCREQDLECEYQPARRDRLKGATERIDALSSLLSDLSAGGALGEEDRRRVDDLLASTSDYFGSTAISPDEQQQQQHAGQSSIEPSIDGGEYHASGSIGSNEDVSHINEDLFDTHESRATGLVGQNSEIQWLHKMKRKFPNGGDGSIAEFTFYLDGQALDIDTSVDADAKPLPETASLLCAAFTDAIQNAFPIIPRVFQTRFHNYINSAIQQQYYDDLPHNVQAIFNIILAIGARYSHLVRAPWREDERDHLLYMSRAVKLMERHSGASIIVSAPDLSLIQATGLLSLYYAIIGHVNRAWVVVGISIRYALAVGLHLQNDDKSASLEKKDALTRVWWSLQSIESLLSSMAGRPSIIGAEHCSVGMPVPYPDELAPETAIRYIPSRKAVSWQGIPTVLDQVPYSSFFEAQIYICLIMQQAQALLYSPTINLSNWEQVQQSILLLSNKLNLWAQATFPNGAIQQQTFRKNQTNPAIFRAHYVLSFFFQSTCILISRPCLCRLDERIHAQSDKSNQFNQEMAGHCVKAAIEIVHLLPDEIDLVWLYRYCPWWSITHNIMQAATVILLHSLYQDSHPQQVDADITGCIRKLVFWLGALREDSEVADRAYTLILRVIEACTPQIRADMVDIFNEEEERKRVKQNAHTQSQTSQGQSAQFAPTPQSGSSVDPSLATYSYDPSFQFSEDFDTTSAASLFDPNFPATAFDPLHHSGNFGAGPSMDVSNPGMEHLQSYEAPSHGQQQPPILDPRWLSSNTPFRVPNFDDQMDESWGMTFEESIGQARRNPR